MLSVDLFHNASNLRTFDNSFIDEVLYKVLISRVHK